ncbi:hypothetical protein Godav_018162, partial [Gossypium davidsonii]|nr:hypothetical protein [Gossypium davidsonii]
QISSSPNQASIRPSSSSPVKSRSISKVLNSSSRNCLSKG